MPLEAPVTTATLLDSLLIISPLFLLRSPIRLPIRLPVPRTFIAVRCASRVLRSRFMLLMLKRVLRQRVYIQFCILNDLVGNSEFIQRRIEAYFGFET